MVFNIHAATSVIRSLDIIWASSPSLKVLIFDVVVEILTT